MDSGQGAATRSRDEVAGAIRALTPADLVRLHKVAQRYASDHIEPKDLLQEAVARALDSRNCPADVDVVKFMAESMRSIAHGEGEKIEHRPKLVSVSKAGDHQSHALNYPDPTLNAEEGLMREQSEAAIRGAVLALFDDDQQARDIVEGTMVDLSADELRELTGLDKTAYASKRKLMRRRIDKAYPEGWKS